MLKIRLKRFGRKKQPTYRIIAIDSRKRRDGRAIEELGFYNPMTKEMRANMPQVLKYLEKGGQLTETTKRLMLLNKIL